MNECPHCGGQSFHNGCSETDQYRATCDHCGAVGPTGSDWWDAVNSMCHPEYLRSKFILIEPSIIQGAVDFMKNYTSEQDEVLYTLITALGKTKKGRTTGKKAPRYEEDAEHACARPLK